MKTCNYCGSENDDTVIRCKQCLMCDFTHSEPVIDKDVPSASSKPALFRFVTVINAIFILCLLTIIIPTIHFFLIDTFSIPLWFAPDPVRVAVLRIVNEPEGERVQFVNFDAFDYDYINIMTSDRLIGLENSKSETLMYEIALNEISDVWIDRTDPRCLVVKSIDGKEHSIFFVGSYRAFLNKLLEGINNN